jgi:hypothetical protein
MSSPHIRNSRDLPQRSLDRRTTTLLLPHLHNDLHEAVHQVRGGEVTEVGSQGAKEIVGWVRFSG